MRIEYRLSNWWVIFTLVPLSSGIIKYCLQRTGNFFPSRGRITFSVGVNFRVLQRVVMLRAIHCVVTVHCEIVLSIRLNFLSQTTEESSVAEADCSAFSADCSLCHSNVDLSSNSLRRISKFQREDLGVVRYPSVTGWKSDPAVLFALCDELAGARRRGLATS